jgi:hypothetical protein
MAALKRIIDPELRRSIVDLGMVRNLEISNDNWKPQSQILEKKPLTHLANRFIIDSTELAKTLDATGGCSQHPPAANPTN